MNLPAEIEFSSTRAQPVSEALRYAARKRIAECVRIYHAAGVRMPMPTVSFDLRGKTAGQAYYTKNHVRLNAVLLTENTTEFIEQTVGHEVAHLAARFKYTSAIQSHGPEWQAMMAVLGLDARRCHSYDVTNAAVGRSYPYRCGCATPHTLSARRHGAVQRGHRSYTCKKCGQKLKLASAEPTSARAPAPPSARPAPQPARPPTATPTVAPARSPAPSAASTVPPSPELLRFVKAIAQTLRQALPATCEQSSRECVVYAEQNIAPALRSAAGVPPQAPTEKQLPFADSLARKMGVSVPAEARADRRKMSRWISLALGTV